MIDKGITYDQLLSDINALPSTPSADQLATYDLTGDGVLDAGDARYHIASQPLKQLSPSYLGAGVNLVEDQRGEMVPQAVQDVLQMAVGSQDPDMRYDSNNDGEITSSDALGFLKYAEQQNYDDASGFMGNFYASELPSQGPTPDDGLRDIMNQSGTGLSGGSLEDILNRGLQGAPLPLPDEQALTPAPFVEQLPMDVPTPNPNGNRAPELGDGMYTTMAMGEEDGGNAGIGPDGNVLPGPGAPATTRMVGEEEGMDGFPGGMATTMAMGEEDGGNAGTGPDGNVLPGPGGGGMATTMAMGEEDGGNPFLPAPPPVDLKPLVPIPRPDNPFLNLDPPVGIKPPPNPFQPNPPVGINPPVPIPRPDNPFLPAPPPVGGTAPFNPFPQLPTGGQGGRTYGNEPVFGGFNPGKNIPVDEFGNPIYATFSNGGIAGLKR